MHAPRTIVQIIESVPLAISMSNTILALYLVSVPWFWLSFLSSTTAPVFYWYLISWY